MIYYIWLGIITLKRDMKQLSWEKQLRQKLQKNISKDLKYTHVDTSEITFRSGNMSLKNKYIDYIIEGCVLLKDISEDNAFRLNGDYKALITKRLNKLIK